MRKRRTRGHIIADLSINHVERFVLRCGHIVEQVQHDYGIDLLLYTFDANGEPENDLVNIQVKATDHLPLLQDQETIPWSVARADLELWLQETMPVILIVYDSQVDIAYWLYVQAYFEALSDFQMEDVEVTVTVYLKRSEMVTENAVRAFAGYKENSCCAKLKEWFAMNRPLRFADLECLLVRLGFQRAETTGSQIVFEHSPSATVLVFPPYRNEELVRLQHRMKTKTLLDLRGLLERSAFDRMAEEIEETATCSS